jgi:hypothetical protein
MTSRHDLIYQAGLWRVLHFVILMRLRRCGALGQVCEAVWRFASSYRLVDPRDPFRFRTVWFVMDELGVSCWQGGDCHFRTFGTT